MGVNMIRAHGHTDKMVFVNSQFAFFENALALF